MILKRIPARAPINVCLLILNVDDALDKSKHSLRKCEQTIKEQEINLKITCCPKEKSASVLGQTRPNFWRIQEQDCGSLQEPRASSPCAATPLPCWKALWGRAASERVPAPRTPSCGPPENTADPEPLLTSSWRWWTPSNNTAGSGTMTMMMTTMMVLVAMETGARSVEE